MFDTANLFDLRTAQSFTLEPVEVNQLKKTSIDYVLCDMNDKPLVAIDFDGMGEGFNVGTTYHPTYPTDVWREHIITLKLKVTRITFSILRG